MKAEGDAHGETAHLNLPETSGTDREDAIRYASPRDVQSKAG